MYDPENYATSSSYTTSEEEEANNREEEILEDHPVLMFAHNEIPFRIANDLFRSIGRSHVCIIRERYLELIAIHRSRNIDDIFSTPLHFTAAKTKDLERLNHVLNNPKVDKNIRNKFGETVMLAALKENVDEAIINMLLQYGCDCTTGCFRGITPLYVSVLDNKINLIIKLIERGADVNAVTAVGVTPLHLAVLASHYEAVCILLNHHADAKLETELEFTPLMLALGFQDIDIRICELLCSHDIHTFTRMGNPVFCAIKGRHTFAAKLIQEGADVNFVGYNFSGKICCLLEAATQGNMHLFNLIWVKFDLNLFDAKLCDFLEYFSKSCNFKGADLVECLKLVLSSSHGTHLIKIYFDKNKCSFLRNFFNNIEQYQLTSEHCCEIINALPIVFYEDVCYIYQKFNFDKQLVDLLKNYEYKGHGEPRQNGEYEYENVTVPDQNLPSKIYMDLLCYNVITTKVYNFKDMLHFLKYHTPDLSFRSYFFATFLGVATSTDDRLKKLITLYKLCEEILIKRSIASLQELSRNKLRSIMFSTNKRPYEAVSVLPIPDVIKDILFLKMPIYY